MINMTKCEVVFNETGEELNVSIIAALRMASKWVLQAYELEALNLELVNTKSYHEVIFSAFVAGFILRNNGVSLNEGYVRDALDLAFQEYGNCDPDLFSRLTMADSDGKRGYRKSNVPALRRGFRTFLVALHIRRAIVLPFSFRWPIGLDKGTKGKVIGRRELCRVAELPELLRLFCALEPQAETETDEVFTNYGPRQRERFASVGKRLIVASGWLTPEDANYDDLLALYEANEKDQLSGTPNIGCLMLADLLEKKYQSNSPITAAGWRNHLSRSGLLQRAGYAFSTNNIEDDTFILEQAVAASAGGMSLEDLKTMNRLPGLDFELAERAKTWLAIENAWLKKVKRESNKHRLAAIGFLNAYLFAYLPYWFAAHPRCTYAFPDAPNKLLSAVFVSDLGVLGDQDKPVTLVDFLAAVAKKREWEIVTHNAHLKAIETLFDFVVLIGDEMPECVGFQQPLSKHDYLESGRANGTNKRPIPRRIFKFFLSYIEAIAAHSEVLLDRILSGVVADSQVGILKQSKANTIDCIALQDLFGFIPVVFHKGKVIPLRRIPNILFLDRKRLNDGRVLRIPHPHPLHQILVALYTGIRHNHIQWLDAETFDMYVDTDKGQLEYAELYVNTDKVKKEGWRSFVDFAVIEILRRQLAWRKLIAAPGFGNKVYYNNNPDTKWGRFYPLFSFSDDGRPHDDNYYYRAWNNLLSGAQGMMGELGERDIRLVRLLPSSVPYADFEQAQLLYDYGSEQKRVCRMVLKSDITPHSARVSVVSHYISILPAGIIGRYITGQSEATVHYYVVPDEEEVHAEQIRQHLMMRKLGYEEGYEAMLAGAPGSATSPFIKADDVNSRLSKSLRTDIEETIAAYGCVSLSLNGSIKTGLDILRSTRGVGAVENKTEICPFGNQCPSEVVIALKACRRCGPCHFAVRSIDHLQAITAKIRQVLEGLAELEIRLDANNAENLTADEWDMLAKNRDVLAEDLTAWQLAGEVLEVMRLRVAAGESARTWHIQRPEIIERHLKRIPFPTGTTDYVLARLHESEAFPLLESPQIRAKFDLLRRHLLANVGNIREALRMDQPVNPAAECLGLIRSIAAANELRIEDLRRMLESDDISAIPMLTLRVLGLEDSI